MMGGFIRPWFGGIGLLILLIFAIIVAQDANRRGMNGVLWGLGVFLFCIVFVPLYLIVRKPLPTASVSAPPAAAAGPFCRHCGQPLPAGSAFCPACGASARG